MGNTTSSSVSDLPFPVHAPPEGTRLYGFENTGNTCYAGAVLAAIYHAAPEFRDALIDGETATDTLPGQLALLFRQVRTQGRRVAGSVAPDRFLRRLRQKNESFQGSRHQDAHEFFSFLINEVPAPLARAWFGGAVATTTTCECGARTVREEDFFELSLDVAPRSLSRCLAALSRPEQLSGDNAFACDACGRAGAEAERRTLVSRPPRVLVVHLKRFKYVEGLGQVKLSARVPFPVGLVVSGRAYGLRGAVVHRGGGAEHGHYITYARAGPGRHGPWCLFDDEEVVPVEEQELSTVYGGGCGGEGYLLFYERSPPLGA